MNDITVKSTRSFTFGVQVNTFFQPEVPEEEPEEEAVIHEDNEWGISLVDDDVADAGATAPVNSTNSSNTPGLQLVEGVTIAYEKPKASVDASPAQASDADDGPSLDELMNQMKKL